MTEPHDTDALLALDAAIKALEDVPGRSYSAGILRRIRSGWEERQRLRLLGLTSAADTARDLGYGGATLPEDPREFGLTAADLRAAADRLYDADDERLDPMTEVSARFGSIRKSARVACGHYVLTGQLIVSHGGGWRCLPCALAAIRSAQTSAPTPGAAAPPTEEQP